MSDLTPEMKTEALEYKRLLTGYIKLLSKYGSGGALPIALTRIVSWLRAYDAGKATWDGWYEAVTEAGNACSEAYDFCVREEDAAVMEWYQRIQSGKDAA